MKKMLALSAFYTFLYFTFPFLLLAETAPDPAQVTAIAAIKAIDNHARPLRALQEGEGDTEWNNMSYPPLEPASTDPGAQVTLIPYRLHRAEPTKERTLLLVSMGLRHRGPRATEQRGISSYDSRR